MLQNALTPAEPLGAKLKKDPQMTHAMLSHALGGAKIRGVRQGSGVLVPSASRGRFGAPCGPPRMRDPPYSPHGNQVSNLT